jgi:hypothetical protein
MHHTHTRASHYHAGLHSTALQEQVCSFPQAYGGWMPFMPGEGGDGWVEACHHSPDTIATTQRNTVQTDRRVLGHGCRLSWPTCGVDIRDNEGRPANEQVANLDPRDVAMRWLGLRAEHT